MQTLMEDFQSCNPRREKPDASWPVRNPIPIDTSSEVCLEERTIV
jgi:hypothetical protein